VSSVANESFWPALERGIQWVGMDDGTGRRAASRVSFETANGWLRLSWETVVEASSDQGERKITREKGYDPLSPKTIAQNVQQTHLMLLTQVHDPIDAVRPG
jgi:hypothetical protein